MVHCGMKSKLGGIFRGVIGANVAATGLFIGFDSSVPMLNGAAYLMTAGGGYLSLEGVGAATGLYNLNQGVKSVAQTIGKRCGNVIFPKGPKI